MKKIVYIITFLLIPNFLFAKDWDPRLYQFKEKLYQMNTEEAHTLIATMLQENPHDPILLLNLAFYKDWQATFQGTAFSSHSKVIEDYKNANTIALAAWEKDPNHPDHLIALGLTSLFLGMKYYDLGQWGKAVLTAKKCQKHLIKALHLDPSRKEAYLALGMFHYLAGNTPKVFVPFKKILGIKGNKSQGLTELKELASTHNPFSLDAEYALSITYLNFEHNALEASQRFLALTKKFPLNPEIYLHWSEAEEKKSKQDGVKAYLFFAEQCSKRVCPKNYLFLINYHLGRLNKDLENWEDAQKYFAQSIQYDQKKYFPQLSVEARYWSALIDLRFERKELAHKKILDALQVAGIPKKLKTEILNLVKSIKF